MQLTRKKFLPSPATTYVEFCGIKLAVSDDMDGHTARVVKQRTDVLQTEFQAVLEVIKKGDTVLDIGAGAMTVALLAAKQGARVIAYEPSPAMFSLATANLDANPDSPVEAHLGWAISPDFAMSSGDLRLPGTGVDEAAFDHVCPVDEGLRVPIHTIEPVLAVLQRERPDVVIIETPGMACALTKAIGIAPDCFKPRTVFSRLRGAWEGSESVSQTISTMRLMGYRISGSYLACDGFAFESEMTSHYRGGIS